jgi:hypothetical protein
MSVEGGRRTRGASPVDPRSMEDGVGTPPDATPTSHTDTALRLAKGYPPVLGAMLVIDGLVTMVVGARAAVSLGEAATFLVLPPLAMLLVGAERLRMSAIAGLAAAVVAVLAVLFLGGTVHLFLFPAWAEALTGAVLLAVAGVTLAPGRSPRGRRRARHRQGR